MILPPTLSRPQQGPSVERWQAYLVGAGYDIVTDGHYGPATEAATQDWQRKHRLRPDGVVGPRTWGLAMARDLSLPDVDGDWPPRPDGARHLRHAQRVELFGHFPWEPIPGERSVRILSNWRRQNIISVDVPQLVGISRRKRGTVKCHRLIAPQLLALFRAWDDAGLIDRVLTWGGCFYPRLIAGYKVGGSNKLSNHSWGTAFDVNVAWNGLGRRPALVGEKGSVRELVELAWERGFFWGGWWTGRPDGMHFEAVRVVG